jgi:predicted metal-dependent phosphoesterase TrpH
MKFDLHLHTHYSSDALTKPSTLVKELKAKGLGGFAITEHNNCDSWKELEALSKKEGLIFVKGEEIKVVEARRSAGEIIGLFMNQEIKPATSDEIFDSLKQQGAIAVIAHPFDFLRHNFKDLKKAKERANAIEVFNSRCVVGSFNRKAKEFAEKNNLPFTAGSDGHHPREVGQSFVECNVQNSEALRKAILGKKVTVGGGLSSPLVHCYTTLSKLGLMKPI